MPNPFCNATALPSAGDAAFYPAYRQHLAEGRGKEGHYLLGQALLDAVGLTAPDALAAFGIRSVWFARYFAAGCQLPTLQGDTRSLPKSQLRFKYTPLAAPLSEAQQAALLAHCQTALGVAAPEEFRCEALEASPHCCHSPCFGCLAFDPAQGIALQGEKPFLKAMLAEG